FSAVEIRDQKRWRNPALFVGGMVNPAFPAWPAECRICSSAAAAKLESCRNIYSGMAISNGDHNG
ncbi:hypothetical protein, partial [Mesorhizobium sp. STM 4661]|uniref:hypothetical protein n=1 Tax=Mesorhizobium sp. STM 4661 TaxID=1297570 RepID=UPI001AEC453A